MARQFNGSNQYLEITAAPITSFPFSVSAYFYTTTLVASQVIFSIGNIGAASEYNDLLFEAAGNVISCRTVSGGAGSAVANSTASASVNTWHQAGGVWAASNDRRSYLDGANKGTSATIRAFPSGVNRLAIARATRSSASKLYLSGRAAEVGIWNVSLPDSDWIALGKGFSPLFIQPENLVAYYRLVRNPDNDQIGGFNLTAFNAPTIATHPPEVVHPTLPTFPFVAPVEQVTVNTVYGLGNVFELTSVSPIFGRGVVNSIIVKSLLKIANQKPSIATPGLAEYKVRLKDQSGSVVAEFDTWRALNFTHKTNHIGSARFEINGEDSRINLFELDGQLEVLRRNLLVDLDWYVEWEGFYRTEIDKYIQNDNNPFIANCVSYIDLLRRAEIKYAAETAFADKSGAGETVIKEYAAQNVGIAALASNGREADNAMPGLTIQADTGLGNAWEGERANKNLLETLQKISLKSRIDFDIIGTGAATFELVTHDGEKTDRTKTNTDGNNPVVFALGYGNIAVPELTKNRTKEVTAAYALGRGVDNARQSVLVESLDKLDSPWNRIEKTYNASNVAGDALTSVAEEGLEKDKFDINLDFKVLQQLSTYYGKHYTWGDLVTAEYKNDAFNKKITEVSVDVSADVGGEQISIKFSDN